MTAVTRGEKGAKGMQFSTIYYWNSSQRQKGKTMVEICYFHANRGLNMKFLFQYLELSVTILVNINGNLQFNLNIVQERIANKMASKWRKGG